MTYFPLDRVQQGLLRISLIVVGVFLVGLDVVPNAWAELPVAVRDQIIKDGIKAGDQDQQVKDLDKQIKKNPPNKKELEKNRDRLKARINGKKGAAEVSGGKEGQELFDKARDARNKQHELQQMEDEYKKNPSKKLARKIKNLKFILANDYKGVGSLPNLPATAPVSGGGGTVTLPLSGVVTPVGGDLSAPFQVFGGYQLNDETVESFLKSPGTGNQKTEPTTGNSQNLGNGHENGQAPQTEPKSWSPTDANPVNMVIGNSAKTFGFQYDVEYQYVNQEAEVFVVAGVDQYLGKWSTFLSQQYDGMAIESAEVILDTTPTFITGLPGSTDPRSFKAHWAQEGFDMSQWSGETLPTGNYLQWKISEDVFSQFANQASSNILYFERDPTTAIAPAPGLSPDTWPVHDNTYPTARTIFRRNLP